MILHSVLADLMKQSDAARQLGVSRQYINNLIKANKLAVYEIGGVRFVNRKDIELRLQTNKTAIDTVHN